MQPEGARLLQVKYVLADLGVTILAFLFSYWTRDALLAGYLGSLYPIRTYSWILLVAIAIIPIIFSLLKLYEFDGFQEERSPLYRRPWKLLQGTALVYVFFSVLVFTLKLQYVSRLFLFLFIAVDFLFLAAIRMGWWPVLSRRAQREPLRVLIVGSCESVVEFASLLSKTPRVGRRLIGLVTDEAPEVDWFQGLQVLGMVEETRSILCKNVVDEVLIAVPEQDLSKLEPLLLLCQKQGITARLACDFLPRGKAKPYLEQLEDVPFLTFATTPKNADLLAAKRVFDVIISSALLVFCLPLFILAAILIRLISNGPVLYRQIRCGLDGRPFTFLKFRSMVEGADEKREEIAHLNEVEGPIFKISTDPRVTKIGRFLRRTSIDELPQLINVLRGEMSLVGPRPPLPTEVALYDGWQRRRLSMKPGLTCLWQVGGRSLLGFEKWVELDLLYIDHWSPWLDLKIMLRTIPAVASLKGAW